MRKRAAATGSAVFFLAAPGVVTGFTPWWITDWSTEGPWPAGARGLGWTLLACSAALLIHSFVRFVVQGLGTPAPVAPTEHLVVSGAYRFVRNPMYVAVVTLICAQALILAQPVLLAWAALVWAVTAMFVRLYEEPVLARTYGAEYETYRRSVRAWLPRARPWTC